VHSHFVAVRSCGEALACSNIDGEGVVASKVFLCSLRRILKSIVNREKGFHFLRLLHHWGDEIWIHEEFPGFTRAMSLHAVAEPVTRSWDAYHADGKIFQTLSPSYAACVELAKEHARKIMRL
jgi:hypothetical protein